MAEKKIEKEKKKNFKNLKFLTYHALVLHENRTVRKRTNDTISLVPVWRPNAHSNHSKEKNACLLTMESQIAQNFSLDSSSESRYRSYNCRTLLFADSHSTSAMKNFLCNCDRAWCSNGSQHCLSLSGVFGAPQEEMCRCLWGVTAVARLRNVRDVSRCWGI